MSASRHQGRAKLSPGGPCLEGRGPRGLADSWPWLWQSPLQLLSASPPLTGLHGLHLDPPAPLLRAAAAHAAVAAGQHHQQQDGAWRRESTGPQTWGWEREDTHPVPREAPPSTVCLAFPQWSGSRSQTEVSTTLWQSQGPAFLPAVSPLLPTPGCVLWTGAWGCHWTSFQPCLSSSSRVSRGIPWLPPGDACLPSVA